MLHSNRSRSPYEDGTKPVTVHYNRHRPHRSLGHMTPVPSVPGEPRSGPILGGLRRRDLLDGLVHEYEPAA